MTAARAQHSAHKKVIQPRSTDLLSILLLMAVLPPFIYYLWFCIDEFGGALRVPTMSLLSRIPAPTLASFILYGCWFLLQAALQMAAPGKLHEGVPLADGTRLKYKMN